MTFISAAAFYLEVFGHCTTKVCFSSQSRAAESVYTSIVWYLTFMVDILLFRCWNSWSNWYRSQGILHFYRAAFLLAYQDLEHLQTYVRPHHPSWRILTHAAAWLTGLALLLRTSEWSFYPQWSSAQATAAEAAFPPPGTHSLTQYAMATSELIHINLYPTESSTFKMFPLVVRKLFSDILNALLIIIFASVNLEVRLFVQ